MRKRIPIEEFKAGESVEGFYLVKEKTVKKTRSGKDYLDIVLQDKTGTAIAKLWDNAEQAAREFEGGDIIKIQADIGTYNDRISVTIRRLRKALEEDPCSIDDFVPVSPYDAEEMEQRLREILHSITDPFLTQLVDSFLSDSDFMKRFRTATASKIIHHNYIGGLLEHTLSIVEILTFLDSHYSDIEHDMLIAGGFFHDIGKIEEIGSGPEMEYTDRGVLLGHMIIGAEMVRKKIDRIDGFPEELATELLHTVLSHQGEPEWGAPVVPMTREALIIHYVDNLDAKQFVAKRAVEDVPDKASFTNKIFPLGRKLFIRDSQKQDQ